MPVNLRVKRKLRSVTHLNVNVILTKFPSPGCTESCHFDNFLCSQWRKFHQNDRRTQRMLCHPNQMENGKHQTSRIWLKGKRKKNHSNLNYNVTSPCFSFYIGRDRLYSNMADVEKSACGAWRYRTKLVRLNTEEQLVNGGTAVKSVDKADWSVDTTLYHVVSTDQSALPIDSSVVVRGTAESDRGLGALSRMDHWFHI